MSLPEVDTVDGMEHMLRALIQWQNAINAGPRPCIEGYVVLAALKDALRAHMIVKSRDVKRTD